VGPLGIGGALMRRQARKAVVHYKTKARRTTQAKVFRQLAKRVHKHTCAIQSCRLIYEDHCNAVALNERCPSCRGKARTWHLQVWDPQPCCLSNCELITEPEELLRYECAGPGPWYQCRACFRTHGHPCLDPALLARSAEVPQSRGSA